MDRRNMLLRAAAAIGAAFAASRADAATEAPAAGKLKVVYHLSDLDKVGFALGNIQNHFDGVGGPTTSPSRWSFMVRRCGRSTAPRPIPMSASGWDSSPRRGWKWPPAATP
jgi:hypothetical protein